MTHPELDHIQACYEIDPNHQVVVARRRDPHPEHSIPPETQKNHLIQDGLTAFFCIGFTLVCGTLLAIGSEIIKTPDQKVVAENEALKSQLSQTQSNLATTEGRLAGIRACVEGQ